jgi:hypothetical protein
MLVAVLVTSSDRAPSPRPWSSCSTERHAFAVSVALLVALATSCSCGASASARSVGCSAATGSDAITHGHMASGALATRATTVAMTTRSQVTTRAGCERAHR